MAKRQFSKAVVAVVCVCGLQLVAATPASALKTLRGVDIKFSGGSDMTLFGSKPAADVSLSPRFRPITQVAAAVPEPAGWMMMLLGFGLLGAITRRSARTPVEAQQKI